MIYHKNEDVLIRSMQEEDARKLVKAFQEQGWNKSIELFNYYFNEQKNHARYILIAEFCGDIAGYTTILPKALEGPFADRKIPEICDFNVLIKYQRKGIGNIILDVAEKIAGKISNTVSLGVGLHSGYGVAQRIYVKRGYIPDGSGVWFMNKQLEPYTTCNNNDDLILFLSKSLV
ncbi:GNAT family N-acetyltransferase [Clostridium cellulovorans]|uniref:GCN5-related N-acetyltransferase n=1 Tax=Clostridium cellulovorans (strain ATCC 35296 / DSM 3052 / OCM 3 / 743B) TaxID=573061 RepID=D9SUI4_CLOC7|nr:GNAT family N-acetyltransferase [Clostridium cellulovorans]ADL52939.1 GCN5-related N-acetyltransferase [Clostridium cellulovorans 743B]